VFAHVLFFCSRKMETLYFVLQKAIGKQKWQSNFYATLPLSVKIRLVR